LAAFFVGIFATIDGCAAFAITNPGGAIEGNGRQVWVQIVGALFIVGWNLMATSLILVTMKYAFRIPLRMSEADLILGDDAAHGESAYRFYYQGEAYDPSLFGDFGARGDEEMGGMSGSQSPMEPSINTGKKLDNGVSTTTPGYDPVAPGEHAAKLE